MGGQMIAGAIGLGGGKIGGTIGNVETANAEIQASHMRRAAAKRQYGAEAEKFRHEGDVFLAEQRAIVGRSGVQRSGSPLDLLASNAEAIERDAATTWSEGLRIARMETLRRKAIRSARDMGFITTWLIPGADGRAGPALAGLMSGERNTSEATLARRLQTGRFGASGRVLGGGYGSGTTQSSQGGYPWGRP